MTGNETLARRRNMWEVSRRDNTGERKRQQQKEKTRAESLKPRREKHEADRNWNILPEGDWMLGCMWQQQSGGNKTRRAEQFGPCLLFSSSLFLLFTHCGHLPRILLPASLRLRSHQTQQQQQQHVAQPAYIQSQWVDATWRFVALQRVERRRQGLSRDRSRRLSWKN